MNSSMFTITYRSDVYDYLQIRSSGLNFDSSRVKFIYTSYSLLLQQGVKDDILLTQQVYFTHDRDHLQTQMMNIGGHMYSVVDL